MKITYIKISYIVYYLSDKSISAYRALCDDLYVFKVKWSKIHGLPLFQDICKLMFEYMKNYQSGHLLQFRLHVMYTKAFNNFYHAESGLWNFYYSRFLCVWRVEEERNAYQSGLIFQKGLLLCYVLFITGTKDILQNLLYLNRVVTSSKSRFS
jgi:hypothetical protein